jgi:hypothetical protein
MFLKEKQQVVLKKTLQTIVKKNSRWTAGVTYLSLAYAKWKETLNMDEDGSTHRIDQKLM